MSNTNLGKFDMTKNTNNINNDICKVKLEAAEHSIKKGRRHSNKKMVSWWTNECSETIKLRNKAFKTLKNKLVYQNLIEYTRMVRNVLKNVKRPYWRNFCNTVRKDTKIEKFGN